MMRTNDQQLFYGDNGTGIVLIHGVTSGCAQMVPLGKMLKDSPKVMSATSSCRKKKISSNVLVRHRTL